MPWTQFATRRLELSLDGFMPLSRGFLALALFTASVAEPIAFPDRFQARYTLHAGGFEVGTTTVSLSPVSDGRYEYIAISRATGVATFLGFKEVRERSVWLRTATGIRSLRYSYHRRGRKERRVEVVFDWTKGRVTNHVNGESWHMAIPDHTFDKQNHLLALMLDLASGARSSSYRVADGGKLKTYAFRYRGQQSISTPFGDLDTVMMERTRSAATRKTTFWLAPSLDYLPVHIEHREGNSLITMYIRAASGFPRELSAENLDEGINPC